MFVDSRYISSDTWHDGSNAEAMKSEEPHLVNPALTAMANAIRVGEHISERIA